MNYEKIADALFENTDIPEWLKLNAQLQQKKSKIRAALYNMGMLKREGDNKFDHYKYFSEAQYKLLFNELFSGSGLELKFSELSYDTFEGSEKQANGRMPRIEFVLFDTDTGFFERTVITGEGIDKGDKAGYKAYTGALKYYLADTFMVATGDDPEVDSPNYTMNRRGRKVQADTRPDADEQAKSRPAEKSQVDYILNNCDQDQCRKLMEHYDVNSLDELSYFQAGKIIIQLNARRAKEMEAKS